MTNLGGHVLKKLGDGLMALFGYPKAQENDAERAVRAALAIQRALADLNARNTRSGAPEPGPYVHWMPRPRWPFKDWLLPAGLDRVRRKLAGSNHGDRQMVKISPRC